MIRLARAFFCLALAAASVAHADVPPNPTGKPTPPNPDPAAPTDAGSAKQESEEEKSHFPTGVAIGAAVAVYAAMRSRRKQTSSDPVTTDGT